MGHSVYEATREHAPHPHRRGKTQPSPDLQIHPVPVNREVSLMRGLGISFGISVNDGNCLRPI
jgi:hypothetical protein